MKQIIYITRDSVQFDGISRKWVGNELTLILKETKEKIESSEVKIVLGNDVSFITSFPQKKVSSLTRENIWEEMKKHLPFDVGVQCFDWKIVSVEKESWIQGIAVKEDFLEYISRAIKENGFRVNIMIPIGILLAQRSIWKETPVLLKWSGMENLSVLAFRGLVDSVYTDTSDQEIIDYSVKKWGSAQSPEVMMIDDKNFNLTEEVFAIKENVSDEELLNIPIIRDIERVEAVPTSNEIIDETIQVRDKSNVWKGIVAGILVIMLISSVWYYLRQTKKVEPVLIPPTPTSITPSPEMVASPSATLDLSNYKVQILNGSGVTGLAAKARDDLLLLGYESVEIGNTPKTNIGAIQIKSGVPTEVVKMIKNELSTYELGEPTILSDDISYDLVIILN